MARATLDAVDAKLYVLQGAMLDMLGLWRTQGEIYMAEMDNLKAKVEAAIAKLQELKARIDAGAKPAELQELANKLEAALNAVQ